MFSWSTNRRRPGASPYPGTLSGSGSSTTATAIQGSIRPPAADHTTSRAQHLDSYLNDDTLKRSTRKVSTDDSTYDTVFQTVNGVTLILRVHFPPLVSSSAPLRTPVMTLAGVKARHEWLDHQMQVVGFHPISSDEQWRQSHLLLGAAVHKVIEHLQLNPPDILEITDRGLQNIQTKPLPRSNGQQRSSAASSSASREDDAPPGYEAFLATASPPPSPQQQILDLPSIPTHFEQVDGLSREELDNLLEDELDFQAFCNKLTVAQTISAQAASVVEKNAQQAQRNLDKETKLKELHDSVTTLQEQLQKRVKEFQKLEQKQDKICAPADRRTVIRELTKLKKEAFDESEQTAEEWLDECETDNAEASVQDFLKRFLEQRRVHHVRAAKVELLQNQPNDMNS